MEYDSGPSVCFADDTSCMNDSPNEPKYTLSGIDRATGRPRSYTLTPAEFEQFIRDLHRLRGEELPDFDDEVEQ